MNIVVVVGCGFFKVSSLCVADYGEAGQNERVLSADDYREESSGVAGKERLMEKCCRQVFVFFIPPHFLSHPCATQ